MSCETYYLQLQDYVDQPQGQEYPFPLKQHLLQCSECRLFLKEMENLYQRLDQIVYPDTSPQLAEAIFQKVQQLPTSNPSYPFFRMVASFVFVATTLYFIWTSWKFSSEPKEKYNQQTSSVTEKEERWTEVEKQKQSEAFVLWLTSLQTKESSFFKQPLLSLNFSKSFQHRTQSLQEMFFFSFSISNFSLWKTVPTSPENPEKPFETVGEDFSELFHLVKEDLSFLSFGL